MKRAFAKGPIPIGGMLALSVVLFAAAVPSTLRAESLIAPWGEGGPGPALAPVAEPGLGAPPAEVFPDGSYRVLDDHEPLGPLEKRQLTMLRKHLVDKNASGRRTVLINAILMAERGNLARGACPSGGCLSRRRGITLAAVENTLSEYDMAPLTLEEASFVRSATQRMFVLGLEGTSEARANREYTPSSFGLFAKGALGGDFVDCSDSTACVVGQYVGGEIPFTDARDAGAAVMRGDVYGAGLAMFGMVPGVSFMRRLARGPETGGGSGGRLPKAGGKAPDTTVRGAASPDSFLLSTPYRRPDGIYIRKGNSEIDFMTLGGDDIRRDERWPANVLQAKSFREAGGAAEHRVMVLLDDDTIEIYRGRRVVGGRPGPLVESGRLETRVEYRNYGGESPANALLDRSNRGPRGYETHESPRSHLEELGIDVDDFDPAVDRTFKLDDGAKLNYFGADNHNPGRLQIRYANREVENLRYVGVFTEPPT